MRELDRAGGTRRFKAAEHRAGNGKGFESFPSRDYVTHVNHAPGFLKVVQEAKSRVKEVSLSEARARLAANLQAVLLDVREESEWDRGHAKNAQHLGKGVLERDIEARFPDKNTEIIMYCGGGFRSALTCDVAQQMGYTQVRSLEGGYRAMIAADWPLER